MSDIAQRISQSAIEDLRVSQWDDAARLQALIRGILGVVTTQLIEPLAELETQLRYTTAKGVWLDHVGERVDCERPEVEDTSFARFGFDAAGVGWGQGPFATTQAALTSRVPLGDEYYRCFVAFCSHTILTDGSRRSLEASLHCSFPDARVYDHADGTVTIRNVANDPRPQLATLIEPMIREALPVGVGVTLHDPPSAPVLTATVVSSSRIDLSWSLPRDHGSPITGYDVERRFVNAQTWRDQGHSGTGRTLTITGLRASRTYLFRVRAVNAVGDGPWSAVVEARTQS